MTRVDLNCDLGEGGDDATLIPLATSANIACGGHADDERSMRRAVRLAHEAGVNIGAHPSYPDRAGFGRQTMRLAPDQLRATLVEQINALKSAANSEGATMRHVKPHGALYNDAARDAATARAVIDVMMSIEPRLALITLPRGVLHDLATTAGVETIAEGFADRTYQPDGTLTPRVERHALLTREIDAADQVLWLARDGVVRAVDGT